MSDTASTPERSARKVREGIVSSDILGDTHGGVFDPTQTDVNTVDGVTMARTVSFYDNEYGFTCNMVRTLLYFAEISE